MIGRGKTTSCWVSLKVETPGSFMKCCYLDKYSRPRNLFEHIFGFFWTLFRKERLRQYGARVQKKPLWLFSFTSTFGASGCVPCQVGVEQSTTWKIFAFRFYPANIQEFSYLTLIIYHYLSQWEFLLKKSRTRTAWMQPFSPRHFFRGPPPLFPICNNPALSLETHPHHQDPHLLRYTPLFSYPTVVQDLKTHLSWEGQT